MNKLFDITGKIALITGSSQGLGFTLAKGLGEAGAIILVNGRKKEKLENAVLNLKEMGIKTKGFLFDVSEKNEVENQIEKIERDVGTIDILINNAGIQIRGLLEEFDAGDWQKILDTNLTGIFLTSRAVFQGMKKRKSGKIINICSVQSELARPTIAPYTASKGGLKMLTKAMATEWGKYNIQVNGIAPGYFKTELTKPLYEEENFNNWLCARTPANRWGDPEELIGATIFLASSASNYVNGHILYVDGGMTACI